MFSHIMAGAMLASFCTMFLKLACIIVLGDAEATPGTWFDNEAQYSLAAILFACGAGAAIYHCRIAKITFHYKRAND